MNKIIVNRVINESKFIIKYGKTVRETAKEFKVSKSTVHKDMMDKLKDIDKSLYSEVRKIFKYHQEIRHINGGNATKNKYLSLKNHK